MVVGDVAAEAGGARVVMPNGLSTAWIEHRVGDERRAIGQLVYVSLLCFLEEKVLIGLILFLVSMFRSPSKSLSSIPILPRVCSLEPL